MGRPLVDEGHPLDGHGAVGEVGDAEVLHRALPEEGVGAEEAVGQVVLPGDDLFKSGPGGGVEGGLGFAEGPGQLLEGGEAVVVRLEDGEAHGAPLGVPGGHPPAHPGLLEEPGEPFPGGGHLLGLEEALVVNDDRGLESGAVSQVPQAGVGGPVLGLGGVVGQGVALARKLDLELHGAGPEKVCAGGSGCSLAHEAVVDGLGTQIIVFNLYKGIKFAEIVQKGLGAGLIRGGVDDEAPFFPRRLHHLRVRGRPGLLGQDRGYRQSHKPQDRSPHGSHLLIGQGQV